MSLVAAALFFLPGLAGCSSHLVAVEVVPVVMVTEKIQIEVPHSKLNFYNMEYS